MDNYLKALANSPPRWLSFFWLAPWWLASIYDILAVLLAAVGKVPDGLRSFANPMAGVIPQPLR